MTAPAPTGTQWKNRRVLVMGLGSFGGNLAAIVYLVQQGASVLVTDIRTEDQLAASLGELKMQLGAAFAGLQFVLGGHRKNDFQSVDTVVVNPAVPYSNPLLQSAEDSGVTLTTEIAIFWDQNPARVVGVTGSNGKSTTTSLIHHLLVASGAKAWLGGNIGNSLLANLPEIGQSDWVVLELSSFQLYWLGRAGFSPNVGVVTNFAPNHLDWHVDLDHYRFCKQQIFAHQQPGDYAVLPADDADAATWPTRLQPWYFGTRAVGQSHVRVCGRMVQINLPGLNAEWPLGEWLVLPGLHNRLNAAAAIAAAWAARRSITGAEAALRSYCALPHRLEFVGEVAGRRFYNDSLATTPESAIVALDAFDSPVVLLAGGYDKQVSLDEMAQAISKRARAVVLMGQTGPKLQALIAQHGGSVQQIRSAADWNEAWQMAVAASRPGDVVLLSPGCASYDWFQNFRDRGDQFRHRVNDLLGQEDTLS